MQISFDGIHVKTKEGRILLEDVSGVFLPGIAAILGPSGAGKSLLLSVLAGHMTDLPRKCQASGSIRVNLIPLPEFRYMTLITAFVKQVSSSLLDTGFHFFNLW
jgi:ABC-type multidrug transport system ATPase subunit